MRTQNLSFSSISTILSVILACLTIPTCSVPVPSTSSDISDNLNNNNTSPGGGVGGSDGVSSSPDKMEVMNWILAAISIVIVVELIFWLFKCVNMVRKGVPVGDGDGTDNNGSQNRGFDATSNGLDDEFLPPYDGLSLPKYCEAMETNNTDNEQLRSSFLVEDENSTATIVTGHENNNESRDESVESDTVEISRVSNHTSTVVVEMNQVSSIADVTEQSSQTGEDPESSSKIQEV